MTFRFGNTTMGEERRIKQRIRFKDKFHEEEKKSESSVNDVSLYEIYQAAMADQRAAEVIMALNKIARMVISSFFPGESKNSISNWKLAEWNRDQNRFSLCHWRSAR